MIVNGQSILHRFRRIIFSRITPAVLLCLFFLNGLWSVVDLAPTQDEGLHLAGGLTYWERSDYRIQPENGNLPQRWIALPAWVGGQRLPAAFEDRFRAGDQTWMTTAILFNSGDHGLWWLHLGRCMILLAGCFLGWLVYIAARRLWGREGGLFSLWMYAWSPTILAHATLATSDLVFAATALFFILVFCRFVERLEFRWAVMAGAAAGLAAVSKYGVVALIPVAAVLLAVRVQGNSDFAAQKRTQQSHRRSAWFRLQRAGAGALCVGAVGWIVIWAFYGFRFSIFHPDHAEGAQTLIDTATVLEWGGAASRLVELFINLRLLPEAYLHGLAFTLAFSTERHAFLLGEIRFGGWRSYFPILFLFKSTPPLLLCCMALGTFGLESLFDRRRWTDLRRLPARNPLLAGVLLALLSYSILAIFSNLNIGHRHILPVYVLIFVLCGTVASRALTSPRRAVFVPALIAIAVAQPAIALMNHGHYLAYFNMLIGPSENARHVAVDSSLDWGQDLDRYSRWLEHARSMEPDVPVYHMIFSSAELAAYGIYDRLIFAFGGQNQWRSADLAELAPGYYAISATLLMGPYNLVPRPWTPAHTGALDAIRRVMAEASEGTDGSRRELYRNLSDIRPGIDPERLVEEFTRLQFERLRLHLLNLDPVEIAGDSILVFRLTEVDLAVADMAGFTGYPGGFR